MSERQRLRYTELAPEGMAVLAAVEHYVNLSSGLEPALMELVRLRASLINGCEYCIALHASELSKHNEPETRIAELSVWRESDAYTERERAAFAWTDAVTNIQEGHASDEVFAAVRDHFTDIEMVNLTIAIASINAWNRMAISFRPPWRGKAAPEQRQPGADAAKNALRLDSREAPAGGQADHGGKVLGTSSGI